MTRLSSSAQGHLAMLLFSALVAGSFSFGSMIANDIAPVAVNVVRFALAGVIIGTAAALGPGIRRAHFRAPWRYLVLGGVFASYFVLMFEGLKTAAPVSTSAVFTLTPVMSAVFGWLVLRQVTTPRMALALSIGAAGALWVIFRADLAALVAFDLGRGEAIYFVGCIAHALYPPLVARLNRGEPALVFTFGMMIGAIALMGLYGWESLRATDWAALPAHVWAVLAYLAVFASAATFVLLQIGSMRLPSAKVMAYTYLTPSWVTLLQVALGKETPSALVLAGVGLSAVALVLLLKDEGGADPSKPSVRAV
ncbi:DMT family transporter [Rhodovulum sp. YNF3179]|uniref:DMT family transporter n=1 Tax=Rhodovulum sp. YNF3179 TaxID=3425127 RepID=UPI003D3412E6